MRAYESMRDGVERGESMEELEKDQQFVFDKSGKPVPAKECREKMIR